MTPPVPVLSSDAQLGQVTTLANEVLRHRRCAEVMRQTATLLDSEELRRMAGLFDNTADRLAQLLAQPCPYCGETGGKHS